MWYRTPSFTLSFSLRLHITIIYNLPHLRLWYVDIVTLIAYTPEGACLTFQTSRHEKDGAWSELTWFEKTVLLKQNWYYTMTNRKRKNNDLQHTTQKTKNRATRIPQKKPRMNSGALWFFKYCVLIEWFIFLIVVFLHLYLFSCLVWYLVSLLIALLVELFFFIPVERNSLLSPLKYLIKSNKKKINFRNI